MPVLQIRRQPNSLAWFDSPGGQAVLAAEHDPIRGALLARPAQAPWLWLGPVQSRLSPQGPDLPARSLWLHPRDDSYAGSVQCGLPLPLPDESIGNVIIQHVLDDGRDGLLDECTRVLEPGGRLLLFVLNPWSPYRARWRRSGLQPRHVQTWNQRLGALGLQACAAGPAYVGPVWRESHAAQNPATRRLRCSCLLEVEKRTAALIPPALIKRQWQAGAAPA
ncbi:MAG: hypothetical protein ABIO17_10165 [Pseudoxanthomonas sp.]